MSVSGGEENGVPEKSLKGGEEKGVARRVREGDVRRSCGGTRKGYQRGGERARGRGVGRGYETPRILLKKIFSKKTE